MPRYPSVKNLLKNIPEDLNDEFFEKITETDDIRIERIVSRGHASPDDFWYDQPENEFVLLLQGSAAIRFQDQKDDVLMHSGDTITIPKHVRHRVAWTDPNGDTVWLAIFYL